MQGAHRNRNILVAGLLLFLGRAVGLQEGRPRAHHQDRKAARRPLVRPSSHKCSQKLRTFRRETLAGAEKGRLASGLGSEE